jgi:hypothetical protein
MPSLAPFSQAVSEKIVLTLANQKQELPFDSLTNWSQIWQEGSM